MMHLQEGLFLFKHFRAQFITILEGSSHTTGQIKLCGGELLSN